MKKILIISLFIIGCNASKNCKIVYQKKEANVEKWADLYSEGKITKDEFQFLILTQKELK